MGRRPCCAKEGLNRGAWTAIEDQILIDYIKTHGEGSWRNLPKRAGLKRCGKSCRLRWLNYLRPDIKRGNITDDEEDLIIRLHKLLGNRWSLIAGRLPGRTDNEIKNYWNTNLRKKVQHHRSCNPLSVHENENPTEHEFRSLPRPPRMESKVVRAKAVRCTKVFFDPFEQLDLTEEHANTTAVPQPVMQEAENDHGFWGEKSADLTMDLESMNQMIDFYLSDLLDCDFAVDTGEVGNETTCNDSLPSPEQPVMLPKEMVESWTDQGHSAPDVDASGVENWLNSQDT
ncbi:hypothetical protein Ancab_027548 [Ancistrocladus abbreviatus]